MASNAKLKQLLEEQKEKAFASRKEAAAVALALPRNVCSRIRVCRFSLPVYC